jgi:hypothetical protein
VFLIISYVPPPLTTYLLKVGSVTVFVLLYE